MRNMESSVTNLILRYLSTNKSASYNELQTYINTIREKKVSTNNISVTLSRLKKQGKICKDSNTGNYRLKKDESESTLLCSQEPSPNGSLTCEKSTDNSNTNKEMINMISAKEFMEKIALDLHLDDDYKILNDLKEKEVAIAAWSITPEMAEYINSLKVILNELEKLRKLSASGI